MNNFPQDLAQFDAITFHFDGNNNDRDDIAAIPMAALITNAAGLEDKTTFFYGNNLSEPNVADRVAPLQQSAAFAEKLGINTYDYQADGLEETTRALVDILNSGQKVLAIEGGPMEAIYRAVARVNPENRGNITLISHGEWNEVRDVGTRPGGGTPRTWDDLSRDFPELELIQIKDQNNGIHNGRGFYSYKWDWLDQTNDPVFQEARQVMNNAGGQKADDPSDAGMLFYAVTGLETANPDQAKLFFDQNPPAFVDDSASNSPNPISGPDVISGPNPQPPSDSKVFQMQGGQLVMEAESAEAVGDWQVTTLNGETSLLWDPEASSIAKVPDGQTLTYEFETDAAGSYGIALHSGRVKSAMGAEDRYKNGRNGEERRDTGNDVFISVVNTETGQVVQSPTKLFTVLGNTDKTLKWGTHFDGKHTISPAQVNLQGDTRYRLEISGRADAYGLDRITLSNNGFLTDTNLPQSPFITDNVPAPTPGIPTPDYGEALLTLGLIDAQTNQIVSGFEDLSANSTIDLSTLDFSQYSLVAQVNADHPDAGAVNSIKFISDMASRTENLQPYALFGDQKGDFRGRSLETGNYTVKAIAYSGKRGQGTALESLDLDYLVVETQGDIAPVPKPISTPAPVPDPPMLNVIPDSAASDTLLTIGLADAKTNQIVPGFEDLSINNTIDLNTLDLNKYSLVAHVNADHPDAGLVSSIGFISDVETRIENIKPYALFGDKKGDLLGKTLTTGGYSIRAIAYSGKQGQGNTLESLDLDYSVVASSEDIMSKPESIVGQQPDSSANAPANTVPPATFSTDTNDTLITIALADAQTNQIVSGFEDLSFSSIINLQALDLTEYNLIAQINQTHPEADRVESIKFESALGDRTENIKPYALFGDKKGDLLGKSLDTGSYEIKATAYSKDKGKGAVIGSLEFNYAVVASAEDAASLGLESTATDPLLPTISIKAVGDQLAVDCPAGAASDLFMAETFGDASAKPQMNITHQTVGALSATVGQSLSGASGCDLLGHDGATDAMVVLTPDQAYDQVSTVSER
ncbi:MAG: hypothetical protein AAFY17_01685 [Cyanobacteria bacterium J06642_11]